MYPAIIKTFDHNWSTNKHEGIPFSWESIYAQNTECINIFLFGIIDYMLAYSNSVMNHQGESRGDRIHRNSLFNSYESYFIALCRNSDQGFRFGLWNSWILMGFSCFSGVHEFYWSKGFTKPNEGQPLYGTLC